MVDKIHPHNEFAIYSVISQHCFRHTPVTAILFALDALDLSVLLYTGFPTEHTHIMYYPTIRMYYTQLSNNI